MWKTIYRLQIIKIVLKLDFRDNRRCGNKKTFSWGYLYRQYLLKYNKRDSTLTLMDIVLVLLLFSLERYYRQQIWTMI